jgi:hypothetical protein
MLQYIIRSFEDVDADDDNDECRFQVLLYNADWRAIFDLMIMLR